jgi:hypothetical protein
LFDIFKDSYMLTTGIFRERLITQNRMLLHCHFAGQRDIQAIGAATGIAFHCDDRFADPVRHDSEFVFLLAAIYISPAFIL